MGWFTKAAAGEAVKALEGTLGRIDSMTTSAEERAELRKTVMLAAIDSHRSIVEAELTSGTGLARSWRPLLMLTFGVCAAFNMTAISLGFDVDPLPDVVWEMIGWSVFGLGALRSADKVAPQFSARQLRKLKKAGVEIDS